MQLNPHHPEILRDNVRDTPLEEAEIRRVEGLGEQYVALASYDPGDEFTKVYELKIYDIPHVIYSKLSTGAHQ